MDALTLSPADCGVDEVWDLSRGMCFPLARAGRAVGMNMVHGNAFGTLVLQQGPRGRDGLAMPHSLMVDVGRSFSERHLLSINYMGTAEKWTFPEGGYPQLLQIGERRADGRPYVDGQHPHSSPVMGLTVADTIRLPGARRNHLKLFFSPRGEATDGPIAFMHRPSGRINPDTPLGHHIGQDVSHISSTVLGASLKLGKFRLEGSAFHGEEPRPTRVDLSLGPLDSFGIRVVAEPSDAFLAMASAAQVTKPEPEVRQSVRFGASAYHRIGVVGGWELDSALIYGGSSQYDGTNLLNSLTGEFLLSGGAPRLWGRVEAVQRTPDELEITGVPNPEAGRWCGAATLGYTHFVVEPASGFGLGVGGSITRTLPADKFQAAYGGRPWSGKVFVQLVAMAMRTGP